jgi:MoxR-like ATPase
MSRSDMKTDSQRRNESRGQNARGASLESAIIRGHKNMAKDTQEMDSQTSGPGAALASLLNPEALRQIIVEACRRGDVKVSIPGDVVKKLLGDQSKVAAEMVAKDVAEMATELAKKISRNVKITIPDREPVTIDNPHYQTAEMIQVLKSLRPNLRNVMMVGPAGSGKTTAMVHTAKAFGFADATIQGQVMTRFEFDGFIDAHGVYRSSAFRRFAESDGGVFGQDEMDASEPSALLALNAYLANGRYTFPDGKTCVRGDNHFVIAACNTWGNGASRVYVGRNQLDGASKDRYRPLVWNYDEGLESKLVANDDWHNRVVKVRRAVDGLKLRHTVTPRDAMRGSDEIAAGSTVAEQETIQLKRDMADGDWAKVQAAAK